MGKAALLAWGGMSWHSELEWHRERGKEEQGWLPREARLKPAPEIQSHIEGKPRFCEQLRLCIALISLHNPFATIKNTITNTLLAGWVFNCGILIQLKDFPFAPMISASGLGMALSKDEYPIFQGCWDPILAEEM